MKSALRSFEENEKCRYGENGKDNVMKIEENVPNSKALCYFCGKPGHKKFQCKVKLSGNNRHRWCNICKNNSHDTNLCRKRYSAKGVSNDDTEGTNNSFMFKASLAEGAITHDLCKILVDCGATAHIIKDRFKFTHFNNNFNVSKHCIVSADGSRSSGLVKGRGNVEMTLRDSDGNERDVTLCDALYIPTFT